ncbi:Arginase/deacetylase [Lophiostoma macrostomum CBS 122681]|uniref:Arginase/deacetylase n=1 Tax=Lophiostoma macrostomum CBS 122681 TaxID=1314788 RepID=A0A6A6T0U2_9PLEO|nr:Arginase/deacetylase [Lophiostoma macrostomum CBS 122681]
MSSSITIIFSPYHVGLRDHRVGDGPNRIRSLGLIEKLSDLGLDVKSHEIPPVDDFEGEIGRSFEILRRTSTAVKSAVSDNSFPLVLAGNCMALVGIACGFGCAEDQGFVYFDAHDDMDTPRTKMSGYFDAMGMGFLAGKGFEALTETIPGFRPMRYDHGRLLYVGLRDQTDVQRQYVKEAGPDVIWGGSEKKVDFPGELEKRLEKSDGRYKKRLVHLDLDVLDEGVGKVNGYESPGGLSEEELVKCFELIPLKVIPASLSVCSFDPNLGDGDKIADIAIRAILAFVEGMIKRDLLTTR